jgi:Uma2 family endonuclease
MLAKNNHRITLEEFNKMTFDDNLNYELIGGIVMMSPRPSTSHQRVLTKLTGELFIKFKGSKCEPTVETEFEIDNNVVVPDLFVYCDPENLGKQRYHGIPLIVVEILSPSTAFNDLNKKLWLYQHAGIKEYWIISPEGKLVTVHYFDEENVVEYTLDKTIVSRCMDLTIEVNDLF